MKRKSPKALLDISRDVTVIHLNVGAGYVTYLQKDRKEKSPRVHAILLETRERTGA